MTSHLVDWIFFGSAIYHVLMGSFSLFAVQLAGRMAVFLYSGSLPERLDPTFEYLYRPLGAYAMFTAAVCVYAGRAPEGDFRDFCAIGLAALFTLRAYLRIRHRDLMWRAFQIPFRRSLGNISLNLGLSIVLVAHVLLRQKG